MNTTSHRRPPRPSAGRRLLRRPVSVPWGLCLALLIPTSLTACGDDAPSPDDPGGTSPASLPGGTDLSEQAAPAEASVWFNEVSAGSGIGAFRQLNGTPEKLHITGPNGGGVALLDADGDGALDVFLTSGSRLGGFAEGEEVPTNRLYHNLGDLRFEDRTEAAGLHSRGAFGQGVAVADVDGDGRSDLFVANFGPNALYRNLGEPGAPAFREDAAAAGLDDSRWASAGAFFDPDLDGDLDLYVTHYIQLDPVMLAEGVNDLVTSTWEGHVVMKGPQGLPAEPDEYYRNDEGRYVVATAEVGMTQPRPAFGFMPISTDHDLDGDPDLFVSNDSTTNYMWQNQGDGTFRDVALTSGVGFDEDGRNQSCMGVSHEDVNADGFPDFFVTNFSNELNVLYQSIGGGRYHETTLRSGLGGNRVLVGLGWGANFFDADHDGDLDLYVANGHVYPAADHAGRGLSYAQPNFLYRQVSPGRFEDVSLQAGPGLEVVEVSRGTAVGDLDDDGDIDVVVSNLDGHPTVLRNDSPRRGRSIQVLVECAEGMNRDAIGTRVRVEAGDRSLERERRTCSSFMGVEDPRLHFGLAEDPLSSITLTWPDGTVEEWSPGDAEGTAAAGPPEGCVLRFRQGQGLIQRRPYRTTDG